MMATIVLILAGVVALALVVVLVNRGRSQQGNAHHDGMYYGAHGNHPGGSERAAGDWGGHSGSHDGGGYDGGWGDSGSGDSGGGDSGGGE